MEYGFRQIEQKWKKYWNEHKAYKVNNDSNKPKFYILDMFPYPSGAGLHVGHPLGYIASDIYARYKRQKGFNVLHPMGFDAFGLPAEQYAIETGQHPAVTTEKNIARYREQLDNIGFCYDWDREVRTSDPSYYKWTQWIFLELFHSWFDRKQNKARPISDLIALFEREGNTKNPSPDDSTFRFDAKTWKAKTETEKREALMHYRLAYLDYAEVWWCEALGTVLANDEVVNGVSERGGHPVVRKKMRQWFLRITEYADRLLDSLDKLDWTDAMKEMQRNWIGKSSGAQISFDVEGFHDKQITVFTTRPDTIFGVDFMVMAPEHEMVDEIVTEEQQEAVDDYREYVQSRSERERMSEVKNVSGCFTGAYVIHPFTHKQVPVWISEYVLAGYGTGAIMAVPSGDDRDHAFAKHFDIPITNIFGKSYTGEGAYSEKSGKLENSNFLNGMDIMKATGVALRAIEDSGVGTPKINYKLRDAGFSRQRYWGEPFPVIYIADIPYAIDEPIPEIERSLKHLPVELPMVEHYKPGPEGQGPLANVTDWVQTESGMRETNTMPGYAGSSWYFLRFMDPHNEAEFASKKATNYWREVDIYIGGTEHAVGHLLYSRMWTKVMYDLGHISFDEPFKRLINQGMIQGVSKMAYRMVKTGTFVSKSVLAKIKDDTCDEEEIFFLREQNRYKEGESALFEGEIPSQALHIDISLVNDKDELDIEGFKKWRPEYEKSVFIDENGKPMVATGGRFVCASEVEKMSKRWYNVVNPDDIVEKYGADSFRMYEMFLGPIEVSKPWDTKGIEGVHRFLKKLWRLYFDEQTGLQVTNETATDAELRTLHKTIKKISEDIERFSFNTAVSQFMICVNELSAANCHKREILEPLAVIITPFAPHLAEELWHSLGNDTTVLDASFPRYEERHIIENTKKYPVAVNGKTRVEMEFALDTAQSVIEKEVLADATVQKWLEGKAPKKFIYVKGKMINVVV
ncbi:MAG: leucine--tRNA ligase [Sphingobacteriales bacterium]|nr:MAG: leucine--tRNA ligase [Sphingobacteriales bacterium]